MGPPPGTWRSSAKAAEHAAKFNLNIMPDDFVYTEEEKNLIKMYDTVKLFEREATRLKEKKARERIYASQNQEQDGGDGGFGSKSPPPPPPESKSQDRKAGRSKKKKKKLHTVDNMSDDEEESDIESVGSHDDNDDHDMDEDEKERARFEQRAAKLDALRDEVEEQKNAMEQEYKEETRKRNSLLATNEDTMEGVSLIRKRKATEGPAEGSLLAAMKTVQTPPHEFSEKLGLKSWKGTVLLPVTTDEPTWTPPDGVSGPNDGAFLVPLENFDINQAQNGEGPNTVALKFNAPADSKRFSFNIAGPGNDDFDSILFHFNPRKQRGGQLVINDKQKGVWGRAVQLPLDQVPPIFGQPSVTLLIQINGDGFDIFIEGQHCARLEHRTELPSEPCTLYLQFPSCDDYGKRENWKVYRAWWGNKESMIKGDVSGIAGVNTFDSVHPRKLFISGLPKIRNDKLVEIRRAELERTFAKYAGPRGVSTIVPKNSSYAFVEFETEQMCGRALEELSNKFAYKISRARRSKHEALMDKRAAAEGAAPGKSKESGDW
jgi:hypothetical protein